MRSVLWSSLVLSACVGTTSGIPSDTLVDSEPDASDTQAVADSPTVGADPPDDTDDTTSRWHSDTYGSLQHGRHLLPHTGQWTAAQAEELATIEDTAIMRWSNDTAPADWNRRFPPNDQWPLRIFNGLDDLQTALTHMRPRFVSKLSRPLPGSLDETAFDILVTWGRDASICDGLGFESAWATPGGRTVVFSSHRGSPVCSEHASGQVIVLKVPEGTTQQGRGSHHDHFDTQN